MVVMLLLFRVLSGGEPRSLSTGPAGSCAGSGGNLASLPQGSHSPPERAQLGLDPGAMPESHPQGATLSWDSDEETAEPQTLRLVGQGSGSQEGRLGAGSAGLEESVGLTQTERGRGGIPASCVRDSGEAQPLTLGLHRKQFKPRSHGHRQDPMSPSPSVLGQQVLYLEPTSQAPSPFVQLLGP